MTTSVLCCHPEDRAAQLMRDNDGGILPVVDASGLSVGMVTHRDLTRAAYTKGRALRDLSVGEAMSQEVFGCRAEDSVEEALDVMRRHRVRRLVVLDSDQHVIGLLSLDDIVQAAEQQSEGQERPSLQQAVLGTLGSVYEDR